MGRIIGTILGAILAMWLIFTAIGWFSAMLKTFIITALIAVAVFIVVWLLAGRRRQDWRQRGNGAGSGVGRHPLRTANRNQVTCGQANRICAPELIEGDRPPDTQWGRITPDLQLGLITERGQTRPSASHGCRLGTRQADRFTAPRCTQNNQSGARESDEHIPHRG
jgi:hypothetical protein